MTLTGFEPINAMTPHDALITDSQSRFALPSKRIHYHYDVATTPTHRTPDKRLCKLTDQNLTNHRSMQAEHYRSHDQFYTQALLVILQRMSRVILVEVVSLIDQLKDINKTVMAYGRGIQFSVSLLKDTKS